jgi:hypothetical protein
MGLRCRYSLPYSVYTGTNEGDKMNTRFTTISTAKASKSVEYQKQWIGTRVVFTTWEGDRIPGTITGFDQIFAIATLDDGTWARLDPEVEVINA